MGMLTPYHEDPARTARSASEWRRECPKEADVPLCNAVKKKWEAQNSSTSHDRAEQWLKGLTMFELRDAQLADYNIRPVLQWKESNEGGPEWPKVALENPTAKSYWAQWDRLSLQNGVLYRRWESECSDNEY